VSDRAALDQLSTVVCLLVNFQSQQAKPQVFGLHEFMGEQLLPIGAPGTPGPEGPPDKEFPHNRHIQVPFIIHLSPLIIPELLQLIFL
jgi:hypothetical protein